MRLTLRYNNSNINAPDESTIRAFFAHISDIIHITNITFRNNTNPNSTAAASSAYANSHCEVEVFYKLQKEETDQAKAAADKAIREAVSLRGNLTFIANDMNGNGMGNMHAFNTSSTTNNRWHDFHAASSAATSAAPAARPAYPHYNSGFQHASPIHSAAAQTFFSAEHPSNLPNQHNPLFGMPTNSHLAGPATNNNWDNFHPSISTNTASAMASTHPHHSSSLQHFPPTPLPPFRTLFPGVPVPSDVPNQHDATFGMPANFCPRQ